MVFQIVSTTSENATRTVKPEIGTQAVLVVGSSPHKKMLKS
jgi:hypothetical protein